MSVEAALKELTDAVKENSDLLRGLTSKAKSAKAEESKRSARDDDGEEDPKPRGRGRPAGSTKKAKVPSAADMKKAAETYLKEAADDEEEYEERRNKIKSIIKKFGAPKFTEILEEDRAEALDLLKGDAEDDDGDVV